MSRVSDQSDDRNEHQHDHFQQEEVSRPLGRKMDASHQEEEDNHDKHKREQLPRYVEAKVFLNNDLRPATGNIDDRRQAMI